jgi:hypothetical protein
LSNVVAQLGVLAQQPDFENWTNLLVVVVMAALWLAGGLLKTMSKKKSAQRAELGGARQGQPPRESWQQRLARKAEELQRAIEQGELPRSEPADGPPQPPTGKIAVRQGPSGESVMIYERVQSQPAAQPEPQIARPRPAEPTPAVATRAAVREPRAIPLTGESLTSTLGLATSKVLDIAFEHPVLPESSEEKAEAARESANPSPTVLDYSDPEAVRKAILHYEILGTPLALREPFE